MSPIILKLGGEVVASALALDIAKDVAALRKEGRPIIIVHGGGPQATALQKQLGQTPNMVAGRRITDDATLEVMKMTVAGKVNVDLCARLHAAGAKPVGLHGASSGVISAVKRPPKVLAGAGPDPIDMGHVGDVTGVDKELLALLSKNGYVPVLACLGADELGRVYNINADTVANRIAVALDAQALVLVTDVPGVLRDVTDPSSRIARLTREEGKKAIEDGTITKGMIPKIDESFTAIADGVKAVYIVGKLGPGDLARAVREPGSVGTVLAP
jgi:acetylglutamate kinase